MNELLQLADLAANKNDRWLFLAVLGVLGVVVWFAVRWLINKHEDLMTEHRSDQQQYTTNLINISADCNQTTKELVVVLSRNSAVLDDNSNELRHCRENRKRTG